MHSVILDRIEEPAQLLSGPRRQLLAVSPRRVRRPGRLRDDETQTFCVGKRPAQHRAHVADCLGRQRPAAATAVDDEPA